MTAYKQAVQAAPELSSARFALAEALIAKGEYHFAAYNIREGLKRDSAWLDSGLDRRKLYPDEIGFAAVDAKLAEYVKENPFDAAGYFVLGYARFFSKDRAQAQAAFAEALRLNENDGEARLFVQQLEKSK